MVHDRLDDARSRAASCRIAAGLALVALLAFPLASCKRVAKIPETRERYALKEISFDMLRLPAMDFPGGPMGIRLLTEPRAKIIGVRRPFLLAETNTSYELWSTVRDWATDNGYAFTRPGLMGTQRDGAGMDKTHPVTMIDWTSAALWCNALTEYYNAENGTALRPVYRYHGEVARAAKDHAVADAIATDDWADGFRLPHALEWELAARYATERTEPNYREYPPFSGIYWIPFRTVSGDIEGTPGALGAEHGRIMSVPVSETERNALGFYGFSGPEGKLWQWCNDYLGESRIDTYHVKRGGSRYPRCNPNYNWPKTKWGPTCMGYDQITFRVARSILAP